MDHVALIERPWRDPLALARRYCEAPGTFLLYAQGGWSYLALAPDHVLHIAPDDRADAFAALAEGLGAVRIARPDGPPFQGGWAGLIAYEFAARAEPLALQRHPDWPDLHCGFYSAILAFDGAGQRVLAIGRGDSGSAAEARAVDAAGWLDRPDLPANDDPSPFAQILEASSGAAFEAAVADVVDRIAAGEIFQANIARRWRGRLERGRTPYGLFERLCGQSPAPFSGYYRLAGLAVVSNSPERFIRIDARAGLALSEPIKGTRPRGRTPAEDEAEARALMADPKDRAENLMIVDLMRNDLARVSIAGEVKVPALMELRSYANVHHLVSRVTGRLKPGVGPVEVLKATFPAGSITGAPKIQAMKVIAALEPPRGPYCGSLFWAGLDGALDSSVLIRTVGCVQDRDGWRVEVGAGGGIVADSRPNLERLETEAKMGAILKALTLAQRGAT